MEQIEEGGDAPNALIWCAWIRTIRSEFDEDSVMGGFKIPLPWRITRWDICGRRYESGPAGLFLCFTVRNIVQKFSWWPAPDHVHQLEFKAFQYIRG